ncbi:MAG: YabP/YqfC family sporulation protein [Christensenellales bacterium]
MENKLTLINQTNLTVTGIKKAIIVSETALALELENKTLQISGKNMEVKKLDVETGILEVNGIIDSIKYVGSKEKINLFKRIFK